MNSATVKIHLVDENFKTLEIQKLDIGKGILCDYKLFTDMVGKMFPDLLKKSFKIYWTDSENDKVAIFLQEGLERALQEQSSLKIKTFYVKAINPVRQIYETEVEIDAIHPNIICDGCNNKILGFRYKCLTCKDFDLCSDCEKANLHPEHPMLRISTPLQIDEIHLMKLMRYCSSEKFESKHFRHRRRHSHDHSGFHKKKRYERFESGMETGEESDENLRKTLSNLRSYAEQSAYDAAVKVINCKNLPGSDSSFINDILKTFLIEGDKETSKTDFKEETKEKKEEPPYVNDFKSVVKAFVSILKPLGVDVNVEVRPGYEQEADRSKQAEKRKEEMQEETQTSPSTPPPSTPPPSTQSPSTPSASAPMEKEVRFAVQEPQSQAEALEKEVEKIAKILANQTMNQSPENDGWGFFEELEKNSDEPQQSTSAEVKFKDLNTEEQTTQAESKKNGSNLYPSLKNGKQFPQNEKVAKALKQMLDMGFTNEGDWLTHLLEAKNGDIIQALEVLAPHKK